MRNVSLNYKKMKIPEILYRYRTYSNEYNRRTLDNNELYFSKPKDFNDPFDCLITVDYENLKDKYKLFEYASQIVVNQQKSGNIKLSKNEQIKEVYRIAEIINSDIEGYQKQNDDFIIEKINSHIGIISFSEIYDNMLMWSHYADFHKGYCLGYNTKILKEELGDTNGGRIFYTDNYPSIDPLNQVDLLMSRMQTNIKATCWSYEKEFRITKLFKNQDSIRTFNLSNNVISELYLGVKISTENRKMILEKAIEKGIENIYQMRMMPKSFKLFREQIK
jgi:hypothetical protein